MHRETKKTNKKILNGQKHGIKQHYILCLGLDKYNIMLPASWDYTEVPWSDISMNSMNNMKAMLIT